MGLLGRSSKRKGSGAGSPPPRAESPPPEAVAVEAVAVGVEEAAATPAAPPRKKKGDKKSRKRGDGESKKSPRMKDGSKKKGKKMTKEGKPSAVPDLGGSKGGSGIARLSPSDSLADKEIRFVREGNVGDGVFPWVADERRCEQPRGPWDENKHGAAGRGGKVMEGVRCAVWWGRREGLGSTQLGWADTGISRIGPSWRGFHSTTLK